VPIDERSERSSPRTDGCPDCGRERVELSVVPGRFHCAACGVAGLGPSGVEPTVFEPSDDQLGLW
jgi:ribosomal protein S27E